MNPEALMTAANAKFMRRFAAMEKELTASGSNLNDATLDEMESFWQVAKTSDCAEH